ncbi:MAG: prepilin-type N-terminal cleavage/methylation domain-containing protein [Candidatus Omnitrophota bacterium]|nr:prepilin-type N-terminal cleavage/methylation domain-containing protein [Candidatus Omnitrophota bacterium]
MRIFRITFKGYKIGFTLTELLIVIIIVAIVAVLALPMLIKTIEKAKLGEAATNLNLIRTGEKIYFLEYGTFYYDTLDVAEGGLSDLNLENPNKDNAYFDYKIENGDSSDFTISATRKETAPSPYANQEYTINKSGTISKTDPTNPLDPPN